MATRNRKRQSQGITDVVEEEEDSVKAEGQSETVCSSEEMVRTVEDAPTVRTGVKVQEEQVSQMDTVTVVKGSESTVTVTWDKKNEGELVDTEKGTSAVVQADTDVQMDTVAEDNQSTPTITLTEEKKDEEEESGEDANKETDGDEVTAKVNSGKRKIDSTETSPSKKTKLISDGFCLYVGNLNNTKTYEEVKVSLANYFMTQSLLVQDIKLDRSKKHAHVDLASEMDLTKALTLNGKMMLDKPMKIAKAKVKSANKGKSNVSVEDQKAAKDAKCLFLKNVPYNATREDILKVFGKAVTVRFPDGAEGPTKGIAFLEFENKTIAEKVRQKKQVARIQGRVLIVDSVGTTNVPKVTKTNTDNNTSKDAVLPNKILFVNDLTVKVTEKHLKKVFQNAVSITIHQSKGKPKRFAFVEFATVDDAEKALQSSQNFEICKKPIKVQFSDMRGRPEKGTVESKTLMVSGLAEKTTAETLKSAFDGAISARVIIDKETGVSRRFGFVDFESDENSKAVKEAMEDCEIDGSQVTLVYARPKSEKGPSGDRRGLSGGRAGARPARGGKGPGPHMAKKRIKKNKK